MKKLFGIALLFVCVAAAQSGIGGPVSGYVLDARSHALRPVNGMPGAAVLGAALAVPFPVRLAETARDYALVSGFDDNARVFIVTALGADTPAVAPVEGALANPTLVMISAAGTAAAVYSADAAQVQVITGLPDEPHAAQPVDASSLSGVISALAVDDTGAHLYAGTAPVDGAVYSLAADGTFHMIALAHTVSALALLNSGRDLVFANQASNEILLLGDVNGSTSISMVGTANEGVSSPVGLRGAASDRELWVANADSHTLLVFNLAEPGPPQSIELPSAPTRCGLLNGRSILVFNEPGSQPLLMLDAAQERAVYFVPVD